MLGFLTHPVSSQFSMLKRQQVSNQRDCNQIKCNSEDWLLAAARHPLWEAQYLCCRHKDLLLFPIKGRHAMRRENDGKMHIPHTNVSSLTGIRVLRCQTVENCRPLPATISRSQMILSQSQPCRNLKRSKGDTQIKLRTIFLQGKRGRRRCSASRLLPCTSSF